MRVRSQDLWEFSGILDWMLSGEGLGGKVWGDYLDDSSSPAVLKMCRHRVEIATLHGVPFGFAQGRLSTSIGWRLTSLSRVRFEPVLASVLRCHPENCKLCPWAGWASSA